MAKSDLPDFDADVPGNNTDVNGASCAENQLPGSLNDCIRNFAAIVKRAVGHKGNDIASSSTTAIAGASTSLYCVVTGTTAITGFGTVAAGTFRMVEFADVLTLTHSAALLLPGLANITTAAGDIAELVSLGSGNWKCTSYTRQSGEVVGGFSSVTATSTDAGATAGPDVSVFRNSSSPADADLIGRYLFEGRDESSNRDIYGSVEGKILDATHSTEDAELYIKTMVAGTLAARLTAGQGIQVGAPTGADKGSGTLNLAGDLYYNGAQISTPVAQRVSSTNATYTTCGTIMPFDDTIPQNTEGDEVLTVSITPVSATSTLVIDVHLNLSSASGQPVGAALFVDTTASAIAASALGVTNTTGMDQLHFRHTVSAGSTSARTYKVRVGSSDATDAKLNGDNTARLFGGVVISSITVTEYLP
jgi:hypothetical protein